MKIFFMTTHANQGTGYARVANKMTNYLANLPGVEVVYYAFQNYPGQAITDRFIDPRIKFYDALEIDPESPKGFGDKGILPAIEKEKPDVLFLYNDLPVSSAILKMIPDELMPPKKYIYLDIVYPWENLEMYQILRDKNVDKIFTFLDCWKKHMVEDLKFPKEQIDVLYHGVDTEQFKILDSAACKKKMGFNEDDFVVVNMNRNSYRKLWSVCLEAFITFLQMNDMNEKIKLYCGCLMNAEDSFNIPNLIEKICLQRGLDVKKTMEKHIFRTNAPTMMPEETINDIYNMGDVGMNTCCGEGFGLTNLEHLFFNKPQIVAGVPALRETIGDHSIVIEPCYTTAMFNFETHGGDIQFSDPNMFAQALDYVFKNNIKNDSGNKFVKEKFTWDHMYKGLKEHFGTEEA